MIYDGLDHRIFSQPGAPTGRLPEIRFHFRKDWSRDRAERFLRDRCRTGKFHSWFTTESGGLVKGALYPQSAQPPRL